MRHVSIVALAAGLCACHASAPPPAGKEAPQCAAGAGALELTGAVARADAKTYRYEPFEVAPGTGRIELAYGWTEKAGPPSTPLTATVLDLGLYDARGIRDGFRGWSGSRQ